MVLGVINLRGQIVTVLDFSGLVLYEAVLSYVGVGVDPNSSSFGSMINLALPGILSFCAIQPFAFRDIPLYSIRWWVGCCVPTIEQRGCTRQPESFQPCQARPW